MNVEKPSGVTKAARAALSFLLGAQDASGAWKDFLLPAGNSNVWVTAFVGGVVADSPSEEAQQAARAGWRFLERAETAAGGWGYNPAVPGDADSTLWGLRLAESLGVRESDPARRADEFLEQHVRDDGGLATYASPTRVRNYVRLPPSIPFQGWTQSHVCVTAAGANLGTLSRRLYPYLLKRQTEEGKWDAYWWFDDEYSTAEAVVALTGKARTAADVADGTALRIERAARWALGRGELLTASEANLRPAFALAHALRVIARARQRRDMQDALSGGLAKILEWQKPDGSWPPSARLRVPRPDALVPDPSADWTLWAGMPPGAPSLQNILKHTFNIYSLDHHSAYTTATVLRLLQEISSLCGL
jgi:hypothetical protein